MPNKAYRNTPFVAGEFYHFFNRANSQTDKLFYQERNYQYFLQLWTKYMDEYVDVWSYCLIANHFHFLVRCRHLSSSDIVMEAWRRLAISYTQAINKQEMRRGSLFQEHPKHLLVNSEAHLLCVIRYIHCNPIHHGLSERIDNWRYSSYRAFQSRAATRLKRAEVLALFGSLEAFEAFHLQSTDYQDIDYCLTDIE